MAYYLTANMSKIHLPLRELSLHPAGILRKGRLRILDLGSGPGTAILGIMDFFSAYADLPSLEFTAVDPVDENLREAERLFRICKEERQMAASLLTIKTRIERIKTLPEGPFDIISLSNVLSEVIQPSSGHPELVSGSQTMPGQEILSYRSNLLKSLTNRGLASDGSLIVIEPALRETSRELLGVRDGLLREGLRIYSPCLMNSSCPALVNPKDWCHEDIPWEPPELIRELDTLTGLRKDSLKFSYVIIRKDSLSLSDIFGNNAFRVVSEPLISKGKIEYYLCGPGGRRLAVRLNRDMSTLNESFSSLQRGNIVSFQNLIDEGKRLRIWNDTAVNIA